jgi:hypothetical protein
MSMNGTNAARTLDTGKGGTTLLRLARSRHLTVAWWWGRRRFDGEDVAFCYVCGRPIVPWNGYLRTWPDVRPAIDNHRHEHLAEMRAESTPTPRTA